ncbi:MAG TPA: glycogen debranching protein GlgX [Rhodanobacter sp.]|nr:glycogen debranching protein GlgX [Rhodanobacter sp.]
MSVHPTLLPGSPAPLGAHWNGHGVNFAVYSRHADNVQLCLFDPSGRHEVARLDLPARDGNIWHGYIEGSGPGLVYGYRVHGPYAPRQGHRFNRHKLLLDPYARALCGTFAWNDAVHGYRVGDAQGELSFDDRDSAPYVPKCRVLAPSTAIERPPRPRTPWSDTVLYELHVHGFSMLHPEVPPHLRGTAQALSEPAVIAHLHALGVTTIELLPIAAFLDELPLVRRGLRNYWGYNPIAPLAMHAGYLADGGVEAFARTVDRLHEASIEVVLDVVFNHTAEGDERGPTLAFRGLDNAVYYRLQTDNPERYRDYTGCGNTLDLTQPVVVELVHAALRYWACEIGVDGFRFDLAAALARDRDGVFNAYAPLLKAIAEDPELCTLKLIAEPWDLGEPGHFLGGFPAPFVEWNDRYRDGMRRFWHGDQGMLGELATRFAGSSDVFAPSGRRPAASLNFITSHDGFTLADLTAYAHKRNEANGEHNRDGTDSNWSSNGGTEGETDDAAVLGRRRRIRQSLLGTLVLSRGTPMLLAGDELSHTQRGNNNAYCQDNPLTWLDWSTRGDTWRDLTAFTRQAAALRRQLTLLRQDRFFDGDAIPDHPECKDIAWLGTDGHELDTGDWQDATRRSLGMLLTGVGKTAHEQLYLALNAGEEAIHFRLPMSLDGDDWIGVLDSDAPTHAGVASLYAGGASVPVAPGALLALVPRWTPGFGVPAALSAKALRAGILDEYTDIAGTRRQVPAEALERLIAAAGDGVSGGVRDEPLRIPTAPSKCWLPAGLARPPGRWALSVQLYSLRSAQSWGIGDFNDLARLLDTVAALGADGVLLSPVHALSLTQPQRASPYSPSSRLMLNPWLISVPQAAGADMPPDYRAYTEQADMRAELSRLNAAALIDYAAVATVKLRALTLLHEAFRRRHLGASPTAAGEAFLRFRRDEGAPLRDYAVFEALSEWFARQHGDHLPWVQWPLVFRHPASDEVMAFEQAHDVRIEFFAYLQWLARRQWQDAAVRARAAGMQLGLIADLALGTDLDSAEAWQWPGLMAHDAELGAPPDGFAPRGQRWGAPPWRPQRLVELDYAPFDALLHAVMRDAGAIRLDHVMGLMRQFWIPRGGDPDQGGYVTYPFETLLQHLAKASVRHRCAVIGEDLGNVPDGLRDRLASAQILGYRVVYFERDAAGRFIAPTQYSALAAAAVSTHDLPTIDGFRAGTDIDERSARGLYVSTAQVLAAREERRRALVALESALAPYDCGDDPQSFADALHRFLAASASRLAIVQIEDVIGVRHQANLPGLGDEAPNWRQRLPIGIEALERDPRLQVLASIFSRRTCHRRTATSPLK